jgi:hypothetical protein
MDGPLDELYEECHEDDFESSWSHPLSYRCLREDYMYTGPLPSGEEYTLVGTYLIRAWIGEACDGGNIYAVKPFTLLTPEERRIAIIVPG